MLQAAKLKWKIQKKKISQQFKKFNGFFTEGHTFKKILYSNRTAQLSYSDPVFNSLYLMFVFY